MQRSFLIKDYISKNYMNESLSVKDISAHVFLSASYVCTFFKNETSQTLNQYLTEYRMEKAKQLLSDARYKIADISSRVGYSDGNYFGKSFKKYTGLSPSEYRRRYYNETIIQKIAQSYGNMKLQSKFTLALLLAVTVPILMLDFFSMDVCGQYDRVRYHPAGAGRFCPYRAFDRGNRKKW